MGRHGNDSRRHVRTVIVLCATAVLVVVGAATTWAVAKRGERSQAGSPVEAAAASPGPATPSASASTAATAPTSSTPTAATPTAGTPTATAAPSALLACRAEVRAGEAAVRAARSSYKHWSAHVQAQVGLDRGTLTVAEAEKIWARTKKFGDSDVTTFRSKKRAYDEKPKACAELPADLPPTYQEAADACTARSAAVATAVTAGDRVNDDWADHVALMERKDGMASSRYLEKWRAMVEEAPSDLKKFAKHYRAHTRAPSCELPG